ncbi:hypothetical protein RHMOL_Rhmol12G0095800 [Rhododendron molle]|uniref:Uncharacterized protein n=1 Tax=Rhododendron molle TaxID=49168 RepID=A0ACC0LHF5_RHOML|nr:hypothetical protein RHMOL_Rhmol12G0095800 [Rhododendron molle]
MLKECNMDPTWPLTGLSLKVSQAFSLFLSLNIHVSLFRVVLSGCDVDAVSV